MRISVRIRSSFLLWRSIGLLQRRVLSYKYIIRFLLCFTHSNCWMRREVSIGSMHVSHKYTMTAEQTNAQGQVCRNLSLQSKTVQLQLNYCTTYLNSKKCRRIQNFTRLPHTRAYWMRRRWTMERWMKRRVKGRECRSPSIPVTAKW